MAKECGMFFWQQYGNFQKNSNKSPSTQRSVCKTELLKIFLLYS